jgi:predicted ABC-type transport system involved in lysophospholipase L1 biosynthesis ATPase subunit
MSIALEIRGLCKRYVVGVGGCLATANVLRGVDLVLRAGEVHVVVGPPGSGKSTLMLCAAGLLAADAGDVRWYGDRCRASASRRALYHRAAVDLLRAGASGEPHVHLLESQSLAVPNDVVDDWITQRRECGDAVLIADTGSGIATRLGARLSALRAGRLHPVALAGSSTARVAEHARD